MELLDSIDSPDQLRKLKPDSLPQVVDELRNRILQVVSEKGGHFASNLGSVELTVALHYIFDTPRDKIVWDVGHQAYGHKILTGRRDRFPTIRQHEGLSGFTSRAESEYDHFGAGHASTSISAALGIAEGMRHSGQPNFSIAVIGDGSLTGGLVYEAMNNAGHIPAKNLVVVFNDNEMSIDPNVGALSKFINHAVAHPGYNRLRKEMKTMIESLSDIGGVPLNNLASRMRSSVKNFFTPGMLFECFGFRYFGPLNGHDLDSIIEAFDFIRKEGSDNGPYLVHTLTTKGKGYKLAEEDSCKYHGVSPFKIDEGMKSSGVKKLNYQDVFANTLITLAKEDSRLVAITAAMPSGTGLIKFQKEFPGRCYDVGIAEAHAVLFAAGMATEGFRPVAAIYSTFLQRAYDQIVHDVALQNLPVIFAMDRAGLVGADGATHQGAFDLSYLRCIPNLVVMAPKDENELQHMLKTAVGHTGPIAIRYPRGEVVGVTMDEHPRTMAIGKGELISADAETVDVVLVGIGMGVQYALDAQPLIKSEGYTTAVINARYVKPLDAELLLQWIRSGTLVVTVEENARMGGFGSSVLELMAEHGVQRDSLIFGMPDRFIDHASPKTQREMCTLDPAGIARVTLNRLRSRSPLTVAPSKSGYVEQFETGPLH